MPFYTDELCSCGSGKPFRKCCFDSENKDLLDEYHSFMKTLRAEIQTKFNDMDKPEDLNHLQVAMDHLMYERNHTALDCFQGLSPTQMQQLLSAPFDNHVLSWHFEGVTNFEGIPILSLSLALASFLDSEKGGKITVTGNLPRKICQDIEADPAFSEYNTLFILTRRGALSTEMDFPELHYTRVLMQLSGLIRKYKGHWVLTKKMKSLYSAHLSGDIDGTRELYQILLKCFCEKLNWAYIHYDEFTAPKTQHTFAYSLFLLSKLGAQWCSTNTYNSAYEKAFPLAVPPKRSYFDPNHSTQYETLMWDQFAYYFGLIESEQGSHDRSLFERTKIKAHSRFYEMIKWK